MSFVLEILKHMVAAHHRHNTLRGPLLQHYQAVKAKALIRFVDEHMPFYHLHWRNAPLWDWKNLPTVDRTLLGEHFETANLLGISLSDAHKLAHQTEHGQMPKSGVTFGLSSGTSGQRGLFMVSRQEQAAWAGTMLGRMLHSARRERIALFLRANNPLYENTGRFKWIDLRYFDLATELNAVFEPLTRYNPTTLVAPPSLLSLLAAAQHANQLQIRPKRIVSVAEVLEPQHRLQLESDFQVPVDQIYQATEGLLAISCVKNRLHIQEDAVALQFDKFDKVGGLETAGQPRYTPIVTDLWRRTQPIIRYRLDDLVQLSHETCTCGSDWQILESVEGRLNDTLYFPSRLSGQPIPLFPSDVGSLIFSLMPTPQDYEVTQSRMGELDIWMKWKTHPADLPDIQKQLRLTFEKAGYMLLGVRIHAEPADRPAWIKRRRVQRNWKPG